MTSRELCSSKNFHGTNLRCGLHDLDYGGGKAWLRGGRTVRAGMRAPGQVTGEGEQAQEARAASLPPRGGRPTLSTCWACGHPQSTVLSSDLSRPLLFVPSPDRGTETELTDSARDS